MKIAHIQLLPMLSGVQNVSLQEFLNLDSDTHKFKKTLICKEPGDLSDEVLRLGGGVYFVPSLEREIHPFKDLVSLVKIYAICKKEKFDIVHTHSAKTGVLGRIAARLAGVKKIIHTVHGFPFNDNNSYIKNKVYEYLEKMASYFCDVIICLHDDDANICNEKLKVPLEKIKVISNGVDIEKFSPVNKGARESVLKSLGVNVSSVVFCMVGRLWEQKNPGLFVRAANIFIKNNPSLNTSFILVGDGELKEELQYIAKSPRIKFLGWRNDIPEILGASDCFVLPSLWEGMPLAILEAQSSGLPCIVSNIQGNSSLVTDDYDGYLFDVDNEYHLVMLMEKVMDKCVRQQLSENARCKIVKTYDIKNRISKITEIYLS
ncbi:MAG: glycosyltransferase family 4 protein [Aeromonas veronii]